jgi:AraC-like DNA-binding protein
MILIGAFMKTFYFKQDSNYDQEYGIKDWLYINNFGYYFNISKNITTERAVPRADYHLLYVSSGEVCINGVTLKDGDAYLLFPHEPHIYTYKQTDRSRYYWVHFTGNKVSDIFSRCKVLKGVNRDNGRRYEKDAVLSMIAEELSGCAEEASDFAVSLFFSFLSLFKIKQAAKIYARAIKELESTQSSVSIASIAKSYGITVSHFIRCFKSIYGITPNEYKHNYRISQATNLIKMTDLSIQEIANQCGFCDPLYFSRIFKKRVGVSPLKYRKQK